jgi:hypothetical protein
MVYQQGQQQQHHHHHQQLPLQMQQQQMHGVSAAHPPPLYHHPTSFLPHDRLQPQQQQQQQQPAMFGGGYHESPSPYSLQPQQSRGLPSASQLKLERSSPSLAPTARHFEAASSSGARPPPVIPNLPAGTQVQRASDLPPSLPALPSGLVVQRAGVAANLPAKSKSGPNIPHLSSSISVSKHVQAGVPSPTTSEPGPLNRLSLLSGISFAPSAAATGRDNFVQATSTPQESPRSANGIKGKLA